jgi:hypothetical protein
LGQLAIGQFEEAALTLKRAQDYNPQLKWPSVLLAVAYAHLGRTEEARAAVEWRWKFLVKQGFVGNYLRHLMFYMPFKDPEVEKRFAEGFIKSGVPGKSRGYYKSTIFQENKLTGDEIKDLVFGKTVTGFDFKTEEEWSIKRTKEGVISYRRGEVSDKGKSWIEEDRLCNQWQNLYGGYRDCAPIFRNPEGVSEKREEYIGISAYGFVPFSIEG